MDPTQTLELQDRILLATLPNVVFDGWTDHALRGGAAAAEIAPELVLHAFPGGSRDLAEHFAGWADRVMIEALAAQNLEGLKTPERIKRAIRLRLEALTPHREALRRLTIWMGLPTNAALAARVIYRSVDTLWFAVGDTATDFSFYTKRALLAGVFSSTILYWLADDSEDFARTWDFLERSMSNIVDVGKGLAKCGDLGQVLNWLPSPVRFARHLRKRAAGQE
jgi:ubiquinone biosynthesis protein COQ9